MYKMDSVHVKNPLGLMEDFHCKAFPRYVFVIKHFQNKKLKYCFETVGWY